MKNLEQLINYPYKIYRAFTIPYDGKTVYQLREEHEGKEWIRVLESLREFLQLSQESYALSYRDDEEKINAIADLITLFFKAPLLADPLQGLIPSPLKLYFLVRFPIEYNTEKLTSSFDIKDPLNITNLSKLVEFLEVFEDTKYAEPIKMLYSTEVRDRIIRAWLLYPADTRPGYNASSLVSHLLITSSLAWINTYLKTYTLHDRKQPSIIRLAAMIHDMAKPIRPAEHVKIIEDLAKELLSGLLDENIINEVIKLAKQHHEIDVLRTADIFSASTDRVRRLVNYILGHYFERSELKSIANEITGDEGSVFELAYGSGKASWEFWSRVDNKYGELIREMSEIFVRWIIQNPNKLHDAVGREEKYYENTVYLLIDLGGIQDFIKSTNRLRTVAAASQLIDFIIYLIIPYYIQLYLYERDKTWLPLENFYIIGGGNIVLVIPSNLKQRVEEILKELNRYIIEKKNLNLIIRYASYPLLEPIPRLITEITKEMALNKITQKHEVTIVYPVDQDELCRACYSRKVEDSNKMMCRVCRELDEFGELMSFKVKWEKGLRLTPIHNSPIIPDKLWGRADDNLVYMMEIIAGVDGYEEVNRGIKRMPNYACLKGDGNNMGSFIQNSFSLSELIEKNFRIDIAMKRSYMETLANAIKSYYGNETEIGLKNACRIWLGTIYAGGDDFLIFSPSWAVFPIVYTMAEVFKKELGGRCSLSFGIVATPPKHSVWHAIESANKMLEIAKKISRKDNVEGVCFDVVEQGVLTERTVEFRLKAQRVLGLTLRPIMLYGSNHRNAHSLQKIITILYNSDEVRNVEKLFKLSSACFHALKNSTNQAGEVSEIAENIKAYRRIVKEVMNATLDMLKKLDKDNCYYFISLAALYAIRQAERMKELNNIRDSKVYEELGNNIIQQFPENGDSAANKKILTPILDIDMVSKILAGGAV